MTTGPSSQPATEPEAAPEAVAGGEAVLLDPAAQPAEGPPRILVHVCVNGAETVEPDDAAATLLAAGLRRVRAEGSHDSISFAIVWHEGRDHEFAQAALMDYDAFRVEIHDAASPAGHCLALDGVDVEAAIAILRGWITGGALDPSLDWALASWGD